MVFARIIAASLFSAAAGQGPAPAPGPSGPGPAPGPATALIGWEVLFEISNYNYFDLNKALVEQEGAAPAPPAPAVLAGSPSDKNPFFSRVNVHDSLKQTVKQAGVFPEKLASGPKELYPVPLANTTAGEPLPVPEVGVPEVPEMPHMVTLVARNRALAEERLVANDVLADPQAASSKPSLAVTDVSINKADSAMSKCYSASGVFADVCVVDVLRDAVQHTVEDLLLMAIDTDAERQELAAWATAHPAKKTALLQAPAPAPSGSFNAEVFVQFFPGAEKEVAGHGGAGRSTMAKAFVTGKANTGADEMELIGAALRRFAATADINRGEGSLLANVLAKRLYDATGIVPQLEDMHNLQLGKVSQWNVDTCATHMEKMVKKFSAAYTRRMVPTAIYNECTNFASEVGFSHDHVFNGNDRMRCRHATVKFSKAWNFGKGLKKAAAPGPGPAPGPAAPAPGPAGPGPAPAGPSVDFKAFCAEVCEIKYGAEAPKCHVTEGKKLLEAAATP